MAKIKLKHVDYMITVCESYDEVIKLLNERDKCISVPLTQRSHRDLPATRISIRMSQIIYIID